MKKQNQKKDKSKKKEEIVVAVSGGFDPVHIGHIKYIKEAKKLGDKLVVILNNDNWLALKKGYSFMHENDRKYILESLRWVDKVILSKHKKGTKDLSIARELTELKPHLFAKGGDRTLDNIPEVEVCKKHGIKMIFNVGGGKLRSSSELVARSRKLAPKKNT
jgi:cytidyltransferase-like protein